MSARVASALEALSKPLEPGDLETTLILKSYQGNEITESHTLACVLLRLYRFDRLAYDMLTELKASKALFTSGVLRIEKMPKL